MLIIFCVRRRKRKKIGNVISRHFTRKRLNFRHNSYRDLMFFRLEFLALRYKQSIQEFYRISVRIIFLSKKNIPFREKTIFKIVLNFS